MSRLSYRRRLLPKSLVPFAGCSQRSSPRETIPNMLGFGNPQNPAVASLSLRGILSLPRAYKVAPRPHSLLTATRGGDGGGGQAESAISVTPPPD